MAEPEKIYRFLRVLEYMGTAERIKESRERRSVKGTIRIKDLVINEAILGDTDQLVAAMPKTPVEEWLEKEMLDAISYFPDDDSTREGYVAALEAIKTFLETR